MSESQNFFTAPPASPSGGRGYNLPDAVKVCLRKFLVIEGRACRSEFWWFELACLIVDIVTTPLAGLGAVLSLVLLIPCITALCRRLHDSDKSALWALLFLVPLIGPIVLLIFAVLPGTPGSNRFGSNPLA
ncbi:MAG: DUF805 domain-containing protein [Succinivibrio sp.]|nr:DUF805 domain-containing protein [Succinivibrio sp.]